MNPDDLARILDELGQRLGPSGEYVFGLAVRQVYIEGVVGLVMMLVALAVCAFGFRPLYRWGKSGDSYGTEEPIAVVAGAIAFVILGFCVINGIYAIQRLLNPEYAAIRDILGAVAR